MDYDIDLSELEDAPHLRKRRGHQAHSSVHALWKVITALLVLSTIGLWIVLMGMSRQINRLSEAMGQPQATVGSLLLGQEAALPVLEPTEEDSIRAWEQVQLEQSAAPQSVSGIRKVYFTFDDGPSKYTGQILDILKEYNIKATFFVVAQGKDVFKDDFKRIVDEGHTLGMHSFTHVYKDIYSSREAFIKDLNTLQDYIHDITGTYPDYYRFPGGSSTGLGKVPVKELETYLKEIGVEWYDWNISSGDATGKLSADQIYKNVTSKLENYSDAVILFHDAADKATTVEALPSIIEYVLDMEDTIIVPISRDTAPVKHTSN